MPLIPTPRETVSASRISTVSPPKSNWKSLKLWSLFISTLTCKPVPKPTDALKFTLAYKGTGPMVKGFVKSKEKRKVRPAVPEAFQ